MHNGQEYVPNISHVFRQDQHMYLLYEVYDPRARRPRKMSPKEVNPASTCSAASN